MKIKKLLDFKSNKSTHLLGIDLRQNLIRLVELSYFNSKYRVEVCANLILNEPTISDETAITAIKNALEQVASKTKSVAIALSHTIVIFKEVQVASDLSSKEIEEFLHFNFAEHIGEPKENINFDHQIIETTTDNLSKLQAVAVKSGYTEKLVALLQAANLCPKVIDIDVYALARATHMQLKNIEELTAVINIDYGQVLIVVLDSKKIVYTHEDVINNESLVSINQILELLDLKLRLIHAILPQPIGQLILGGEKATLPGLIDALNDRLNIRATIANPFLGMELSSVITPESASQLSPLMLISCGLALRVRNDDRN